MLSKKVQQQISEFNEKALSLVGNFFEEGIDDISYFFNDDCTEATLFCFKCMKSYKVKPTDIYQCPECGTSQNTPKASYRAYNNSRIMKLISIVENGNAVGIANICKKISVVNDEMMVGKVEVTDLLIYEEDTDSMYYYTIDDVSNEWIRRQKYVGDGYYGNVKEEYRYESPALKARLNKLSFVSMEKKNISNLIHSFRNSGKKLNQKNRTKKKDMSFPEELPVIDVKRIQESAPLLNKVNHTMDGPIHIYTCAHCGKQVRTAEEHYYSAQVCDCVEGATSTISILGIATKVYEDNSIIFKLEEYEVSLISEILEYKTVARCKGLIGYIYVTESGLHYFPYENIEAPFSTLYEEIRHYKDENRYRTYIKYETISMDSKEQFYEKLQNSVLKYSGYKELIEYSKINYSKAMIKYIAFLELYNKSNCVEKIAKLNMPALMDDLCDKKSIPRIFNKNETEAHTILGISKHQMSQLREANGNLSMLNNLRKALKNDPKSELEDVLTIINTDNGVGSYDKLISLDLPHVIEDTKRIANYLRSLDDYQCMNPVEGFVLWVDYLNMSKEIKSDMTDKNLVYTNSLKISHDRTVRKYNNLKNIQVSAGFAKAISKYAYLTFENDDFIVRPPKSQEELYEEGRILNHCVGSYAKSVANGKSIILFVRSKDTPDNSLVTVEIKNKSIVQAKGKYNIQANRIAGVKDFLVTWTKEKELSIRSY